MSFKKLKNATKENRPGSKVDCEEIPIQLREMASPGNGESTIMRFDCAQGKDVFVQGFRFGMSSVECLCLKDIRLKCLMIDRSFI